MLTRTRQERRATACVAVVIAAFGLMMAVGTSFDYAVVASMHLGLVFVALAAASWWTTPIGICILSLSFQGPILAHFVKLLNWSPLDVGLLAPIPTIGYHALGMACIVVGSLGHVLLRGRRPLLAALNDAEDLNLLWICSTLLALAIPPAMGSGISVVANAMSYFIFAPTLSMCAAVAHAVVSSGGKRLITWRVVGTLSIHFLYALSLGSKQTMGDLFLSLVVTALAYGFKFRVVHATAGAAALAFGWIVIFPLAHIRSTYAGGESIVERLSHMNEAIDTVASGAIGIESIEDPAVRALVLMANAHYRYLETTSSTLARVSLYPVSDMLIAHRMEFGPIGAEVYDSGLTLIPKSISGVASEVNTSNLLGRLTGVLAYDDEETGISFGPFAENFAFFDDLEGVATTTVTWGVFAIVLAFCFGGLQHSVWACAAAVAVRHGVSESSSLMQIYSLTRTIPALLAVHVGVTIVRPFLTSRSRPVEPPQVPATSGRTIE